MISINSSLSFADDADKRRIAELENQVQSLNGKVENLINLVNKLVGQQQNQVFSPPVATPFMTRQTSMTSPKLSIRGFGHVQYDVKHSDNAGGTESNNNNFANGGVDLFITSQISENISFLNETVFEFGENGANVLDVERVMIKYEISDALNISAGRGHTALGFWNERYHHGTWLQTTTTRPTIYNFEDDGGILPVHFVGLQLTGDIP